MLFGKVPLEKIPFDKMSPDKMPANLIFEGVDFVRYILSNSLGFNSLISKHPSLLQIVDIRHLSFIMSDPGKNFMLKSKIE
jgi:hypothetical protein